MEIGNYGKAEITIKTLIDEFSFLIKNCEISKSYAILLCEVPLNFYFFNK